MTPITANNLERSGILLALVGPAGGGKTTFCERLLKSNPSSLKLSVSVTSRPARQGETEGQSYYFVSEAEFRKRAAAGEFFEWEEVHGKLYGTLKKTVEEATAGRYDLLLDIDIKGALNFKRKLPINSVIVFLTPPSVADLVRRLKARGPMADSELDTRLATARQEFKTLLEDRNSGSLIDYFIINDRPEETFERLSAVLSAERLRLARLDGGALTRICSQE